MNRTLFALACAGVLGASCAPNEHVFYIDQSFTQEQVAMLHNAADQWNAISNAPIHLVTRPCEADENCVTRRVHPGALGSTVISRGFVTLDPALEGDVFLAVTLHEFGHALGIRDHTERGVMSVGGSLPTALFDEDWQACRGVGACD